MKYKISREFTNKIRFILDECIPPIIRDSKWFNFIPFRLLFGKKADLYLTFKDNAPNMTEGEYKEFYANISDTYVHGDTDLSVITINKILDNLSGQNIVDVGCGRGYLVKKMADKGHRVTGVDLVVDKENFEKYPQIEFIESPVERLPFADEFFDTVVCTHTLEHVLNFEQSVRELRRIAKKRLIVVIPQQRPYKYTFDPHVRFFPYASLFLIAMGSQLNATCEELNGDLVYIENY